MYQISEKLLDDTIDFLLLSKKRHYFCDDTWYNCPKHEEGCTDKYAGSDCNCGADEYNEKLDIITNELKEIKNEKHV